MDIQTKYDQRDVQQSYEFTQKLFSRMPCQDEKSVQLSEAQKVDKYNCLRAFQMCLQDGFQEESVGVLNDYLGKKKKEDLQQQILSLCQQRMESTPDEVLMNEFQIIGRGDGKSAQIDHVDPEKDEADLDELDDIPEIFKVDPSDFKNEIEYTRAIIKHVRRTHSIDDRMENARKESISKQYTTRNIWPTALSCPLVTQNNEDSGHTPQEFYYVKAIVPICKQTYEQTYSIDNLGEKPKFKIIKQEFMKDQVIFGILTANNSVGQMPPVQICDQNHEAGALWLSKFSSTDPSSHSSNQDPKMTETGCEELCQNYQFTYSFEDVYSSQIQNQRDTLVQTKKFDPRVIMQNFREKAYEKGWRADHCQNSSQQHRRLLKIDLKKLQEDNTNIMDDILAFNQLLFQQISSKKDLSLSYAREQSKNYLLVPLSLVKAEQDDPQLQYKLDLDIIRNSVNEQNWVSIQDFVDAQSIQQRHAANPKSKSYEKLQEQLKHCVFFDRFQKGRCLSLYEILPSLVERDEPNLQPIQETGKDMHNQIDKGQGGGLEHRFSSEKDLQQYILKTVFGRKKACLDGSLQDWLYLYANKLSSIREIRESIQKLASLHEKDYPGQEMLQKILDAELVISEEIKTIDNSNSRFAYKFYPLPLNPTINQKKRKSQKTENQDGSDQQKKAEEQKNEACLYQRKDNVQLHNAMTVCFHPFMIGFEPHGDGWKESTPNLIWYKAMQLPLILNYFERACYLKDINYELFSGQWSPLARRLPGQKASEEDINSAAYDRPSFLNNYLKPGDQIVSISKSKRDEQSFHNDVLPEYLNWATSAGGITSTRQTYETLESYGDTVLKLAATLLSYEWKKDDKRAGEGDIENMKVAFITNFHLFRVGFNLKLHRYIKTLKDPDSKEWVIPLSDKSFDEEKTFKTRCVGKAVSDCVEALIGALFLTSTNPLTEKEHGETGLYRTMRWLDDIKCIPLKTSGILKQMKSIKTSTLDLKMPLYLFNFSQYDKISDVYQKYLDVLPKYESQQVVLQLQKMVNEVFNDDIGELGSRMNDLGALKGQLFIQAALERLQDIQKTVLNYQFKNPMLLLAAFTHPSAKNFYHLEYDYEKLEALGDAILDYVININMMRYTMFERYLPQYDQPDLTDEQIEFLKTYQVNPDYQPGDAHQAKLKLVKNELLAKMCCVLGFHKYCLFYDSQENLYSKKDVRDYLEYSFTAKNFPMNQRQLEPFETPKILGDVFESVMGAVYEDGGLDEVHKVYKHLLAPLILYNSQFSKLSALYGEPKEQFQWKCHEFKIKPKYRILDEPQSEIINNQVQALMYTCEVIYRNGQTMCSSVGSSKRQAERNAAVTGLIWLDDHVQELKAASSKKKQTQQPRETAVAFTQIGKMGEREEKELAN